MPERFSGGGGQATTGAILATLGSALWASAIVRMVLVRSNGAAIGAIVVGLLFAAGAIASAVVPQLRARTKWTTPALLGVGAFVSLVSAGVFYSDRRKVTRRCEELVAKIESDKDKTTLTLEAARRWFDEKASQLDEADRVCSEAEATAQLAGIAAGREALTNMRKKAADDAAAGFERAALKHLDEARGQLAKAKVAFKKPDDKDAASLLVMALANVARAEQARQTCTGLDETCKPVSPDVERALVEASARAWLKGKDGDGILKGPKSKDSVELVDEIHALFTLHSDKINAVYAAQAREQEAQAAKNAAAAAKAKFRGDKPIVSGYDGSIVAVNQYLRRTLKDPDSYQHIECTDPAPSEIHWVARCTYRAKNSFGGYVVSTHTFQIRDNEVVGME